MQETKESATETETQGLAGLQFESEQLVEKGGI